MESIAVELMVVFLLILANGFFSGSELAIISARKSTIARLIAEGNTQAMMVEKLQKDPHRFLATVQIGVTVVGSLASAVGGATAVEYLKPQLDSAPYAWMREAGEPISIGIVVALVSYFSLILGELAPKTIGLQFADRMSLIVAKPINALATIGGVAVTFLTLSNRAVLAMFGVKPTSAQEFVTREEVLHTVTEGVGAGALSEHEQKVIENMLDFSRTQVSEVMVTRLRMILLDIDSPKDVFMQVVRDNMYTRYPVYQNDRDNIVGFIHSKDLFLHPFIDKPEFKLCQIMRTPMFVPENKRASDLLREMQHKRMQMAFVVDEYGSISGLVTTEDLLEELVGEIEDEHDIGDLRRAERLPDGSMLVDGLISLNDLEELLDMKFEEDLPYDTLAGLILNEVGRFPRKGEKIEWNNLKFICEEITPTSIVKVRIFREEFSLEK
ncbi:MAG: transporter [Geobacteraceae bacterium GWC2_55_20]|nr:MAG: transporter [Geobacteraceae bacterium GWC2_55_20]HBA72409.1 HlyC/CorC family transporter [Geobacter sp.]HCE66332.1 HlyC/CorC family transporter [Geobacter sp.]